LTEWYYLQQVEPWDTTFRADLRNAMLCALTANLNRKKGSAAVPVERFLPRYPKRPAGEQMTWQDIKARMIAVTTALGGKAPDGNLGKPIS
jgi:hypothetical protein